MAACGSLRPLFESPAPDNPTFLETLSSWNQIKQINTIEQSSLTEIFGELHFKEKTPETSPENKKKSSLENSDRRELCPSMDSLLGRTSNHWADNGRFQLCTEGLGFESSDDVEDSRSESGRNWSEIGREEDRGEVKRSNGDWRSCRSDVRLSPKHDGGGGGGKFPPPISCIGSSGKPSIWFKSYKGDGRFVLREISIPTKEFLHASRKDGRLRLHLVQHSDDIIDARSGDGEKEEEQEEEHREKDADEGINNCSV